MMGLFSISGTITAIGQSIFNNDFTIYAYVEVTEASGRRVIVEKVIVCNDVAAMLLLGGVGEFFFDKWFVFDARFRAQLWAIKSDRAAVLDRRDVRKSFIAHHLVWGTILLPVVGVGLLWLLPGLASLFSLLSGSVDRRKVFYGNGSADAQRVEQQQPVRI